MQEVVKVVMAVALRWLGQADGWACAASRAEVAGCRFQALGDRVGRRQRRDGTREMGRGRRSRQKIKAQQRGRQSGTRNEQQAAGRVGEGAGKWRRKQCRRGRDAGRQAACGAQQWRPWMRARLGRGYGRGRIVACTLDRDRED
jgi:hypothetical protein